MNGQFPPPRPKQGLAKSMARQGSSSSPSRHQQTSEAINTASAPFSSGYESASYAPSAQGVPPPTLQPQQHAQQQSQPPMMHYSRPQAYMQGAYTPFPPAMVRYTSVTSPAPTGDYPYATLAEGVSTDYQPSPENQAQAIQPGSLDPAASQHAGFYGPPYVSQPASFGQTTFYQATSPVVPQTQYGPAMSYRPAPYGSGYAMAPGHYPYGHYGSALPTQNYAGQAWSPIQQHQTQPLQTVQQSQQRQQQHFPHHHQQHQLQSQQPQGWQTPFSGTHAPGQARPPSPTTVRQGSTTAISAPDSQTRPQTSGLVTASSVTLQESASNLNQPIQSSGAQGGIKNSQQRSSHVLWCGNVPADATVPELWDFFAQLPPDEEEDSRDQEKIDQGGESRPSHGILSIFIIARSNCAFVNYATQRHLDRAVTHFSNKSLRPHDPRCPKLVCRIRKKEDEAQAGVAGQRGKGIHVAYAKEHERKLRAQRQVAASPDPSSQDDMLLAAPQAQRAISAYQDLAVSSPATSGSSAGNVTPKPAVQLSQVPVPQASADQQSPALLSSTERRDSMAPSNVSAEGSSGSISFSSTNSSLFRHEAFRERFFILKSLRVEDLDRSVQTGTWATQPHNEAVLDQAFRNSVTVYLIFSANQSGGFFGYARMMGSIGAAKPVVTSISEGDVKLSPAASTGRVPSTILEGDEEVASYPIRQGDPTVATSQQPNLILPDDSLHDKPTLSPQQLTPLSEETPPPPPQATTFSASTSSDDAAKQAIANKDVSTWPERVGGGEGQGEQYDMVTNNSWPVSTYAEREREAIASRRKTLSPNYVFAKPPPNPSTSSIPALTTTQPDDVNAGGRQGEVGGAAASGMSLEVDEDGVRRKDMVGDHMSLSSKSSEQSVQTMANSDASSSLGPSDPISVRAADARAHNQLAITALIHNLRLDERESALRVQQLEAGVTSPSDEGGDATSLTPRGRLSIDDSLGRSFAIQWIKTTPLPFAMVRKLRNPWRDNRQVKVSRDGTELEPNVGRQLLAEWEKVESKSSKVIGDEDEDEDED